MQQHIRKEFAEVSRELAGKKPRSVPKQQPRSSPRLKMSANFAHALVTPFSPNTQGVRVPDMYSFPSDVYHVHGVMGIKSTATGYAGGLFLPNPDVSFIDTCMETAGLSCVGASSMALLPTVSYAGPGTSAIIAYQAANMSTVSSTFRLASWGIRITNLQTVLGATGKLYVALVPTVTNSPNSVELLQYQIGATGTLTNFYVGEPNLLSAGILGLPVSRHLDWSELVPGSLDINGRVLNPTFYNFKMSSPNPNNGTSTYNNSSFSRAGGVASGDNDVSSMPGGCGIAFFAEGCPINTNIMDVEYIYHFETTPIVNSTFTTPIPSGINKPLQGDTQTVESALIVANQQPAINFKTEIEEMADTAFGIANKIYDASQTPLGRVLTGSLMAMF